MITVNFTWVLNSTDPYIARLLHDNRCIDIGELIPNAIGNPAFGMIEKSLDSDRGYGDNLEYLDNLAKWAFSHPDYNFRLTHHIYNPHHEVFENAENVHRAFKNLEYNLLDQLSKHDRRPNVSVVSLEELIEQYPEIADDPLVRKIEQSEFKDFAHSFDHLYLIGLYNNLGDTNPRIELNFDVTPARLNESLGKIPLEIEQKIMHLNFESDYCLPIKYCVDFPALYISNPNNVFIKSIVDYINQGKVSPDVWLNRILNDNFFDQFGSINSEGRVFKDGVETEGILFNMKFPGGGTWWSSLEENIAHSHSVDWDAVYDYAQVDPEFNMF